MASETATQHSSRPECWCPNCYANSRGVPLRVRYPVDIMGGCTGVFQAEQCKEVTINKIMIVYDQHQEWGGRSSWWIDSLPRRPRQKDKFAKCVAWSGCHSQLRQNKWQSLVFLAFEVYTPTPAQYQLHKRAVAKDMGIDIQCAWASVGLLAALLINVRLNGQQHCYHWVQTKALGSSKNAESPKSRLVNPEQAKRWSCHEGANTGVSYT
jgi:hypothetical protein